MNQATIDKYVMKISGKGGVIGKFLRRFLEGGFFKIVAVFVILFLGVVGFVYYFIKGFKSK